MKYSLSEIIDVEELKHLCESFTAINGTVTAILDLDGKVLVATGWQPICTQFHRINIETRKRCNESDTILAGQLEQGKKYNVYKCKNGLIDVAIPIMIENEHIGNFFTGQVLTEKPDKEYFRQQAKQFGFDENKYLIALENVPIFNENQIKKNAEFLVKLTETIGKTGLKNLKIHEQTKQLKAAKEKAEESQRKLKSVTDNMFDLVALTDLYGNFEFLGASHKILGYDIDWMIGKNVMDFVHPDDLPKVQLEFKSFIDNKTDKAKSQYRYLCSDGLYLWFETYGTFIYDKNDNPTGIIFSTRDITEQKKTQDELQKAKEKAEESDRLKSAFLQNLSHEIRTPLNAICGFSGRLNKPQLSEEKRESFVSIIQNSSNQLLSIISHVLTISALETNQEKVNIDKVCVNNIIVDLLAIFKQQSVNQNISLYTKQPLNDKQSEIYTDKTKITQILSNLISNAMKFTHEGFIEFGYTLKNTELEFYVKDSGIGIKQELQEKIFERFGQADLSINRKYGGTGLGLAISKGFAELLSGKIWVNSEIDKGSTFYFTIPYKPVNEIDNNQETEKQTNNKPVILVAEDEEFNFLYIEELLNEFDYTLIHAKDGQETVDIFKSNPDISLILMDIKMPIMDGHTAAKIIKEQKPNIQIIAQSAYALEHEIEKYSGIFDDYLTKPITEDNLIEKVTKYMNNK